MTVHACDGCLRRTWLVARLGGAIEIARHEKRALRELLALPAERLIAALGSRAGGDVAAELEHADPGDLRAAADAAALAAAQDLALSSGDPEADAARFAQENGTVLVDCACAAGDADAVVTVRRTIAGLLLVPGPVSIDARARATVDLP